MAKVKKAIKALKKSISKRNGAKRQPAVKSAKKADAVKKNVRRGKVRFQAPQTVIVEKLSALAGKGNKYIAADKKRELFEKLLRMRERITGQINFLVADNLSRTQKDAEVDFRSEEQGTDNFERDFALNRVSLEQDIVFEIDEALNRMKTGSYGACEGCGGPIEKARLGALPYSRMCVSCQSKLETGRKKFRSFETAALFPNADNAATETVVEEE
ncbi:MAG: TraR/DksA family transcriptional regulator [Kiritimatiellae bacterium]|nr:TraR/DksA family transcriptional regulator [Kiritimatiellia bacterium]